MDIMWWSWWRSLKTSQHSSHLSADINTGEAPQGQSGSGDDKTKRAVEITKEVERHCKVVDDALLFNNSIKGNLYHTTDYLKLCGDNRITFNSKKFHGWDGELCESSA